MSPLTMVGPHLQRDTRPAQLKKSMSQKFLLCDDLGASRKISTRHTLAMKETTEAQYFELLLL